ncbi:hypothetical protein JXA84_06145 [candidate division WOR-3 bacterium]|nr:hypothetical protein [candidate division WOR-3 bacterium]
MNFEDFFSLLQYLDTIDDWEKRQKTMNKTIKGLATRKKLPLFSKDGKVLFAWIDEISRQNDKTIFLRHSDSSWERDGYLGKYYDGNIRLALRNFGQSEKVLYKFEYDEVWFSDPLNPNVEWDGTVGKDFNSRMNSVLSFSNEPSWPNGRTEVFDVNFQIEGFNIQIRNWVMLPPDYDRNLASYPLLVLTPGEHYATHFELSGIPEKLFSQGLIIEYPLIVGVSSEITESGRPVKKEDLFSAKGAFGTLMENYFTNFLLFEIETRYRTKRNPAYRTIGGLEEGAFFALKTGLDHPDVFSGIICQSLNNSSETDLIPGHQKDSSVLEPFVYFDCGEFGNHAQVKEVALILKKKGYKYVDITVFKNQQEKYEEIKPRQFIMLQKVYGRFPLSAERFYD